LRHVKKSVWYDGRPITLGSFSGDLKYITKVIWHGNNQHFSNVQEDVLNRAEEILRREPELFNLITSVGPLFVKQMSVVLLGVEAILKLEPNRDQAKMGFASRYTRMKIPKGEKVISGYLNRNTTHNGFKAEITKFLMLRDGIAGAKDYDGAGKGFNDPQAVRDREQIAYHLWAKFLNLAEEEALKSVAHQEELVSLSL
jgi:hypothetical protein